VSSGESVHDPHQAVVQAGVQLLEALAALIDERGCVSAPSAAETNGNGVSLLASFLTTDGQGQPVLQLPVPSPEMMRRGAAALRTILQKFAAPPG